MLEAKIRNALIELLDNPIQKTKKLLPDFEDRRKLYSLPAFDYIVIARRETEKAAARIKGQIRKNALIRDLAREKKEIEGKIKCLPSEEKIPVTQEQIIKADKREGKSISCYDAEVQALGENEKYVCLIHNLLIIKDCIFEKCKQIVRNVMETVSADYRHYASQFIRKRFGYAPAKKVIEIPREKESKRYREINILADNDYIQNKSKIEELMLPENQSQAEASGWSKLSQAGFINAATGKLECSFA